mgnify:FL=1
MSKGNSAYHVVIDNNTKLVRISCIGMECVDSDIVGEDDCIDNLPKWMQGRLAVLYILSNKEADWVKAVEGVGKRLRSNEYLVYDQAE